MNLSKIIAVVPLFLCAAVMAQDESNPSGFWVGAGLGAGELNLQQRNVNHEEKSRAFSSKLEAGYNVNDNFGYYTSYDFMQYVHEDRDIHLGSLGIKGTINLSDDLSMYGKVGVTSPIGEAGSGGLSTTLGAGLSYRLNHAVSTKLGVDYYDALEMRNHSEAELIQVVWGLEYQFGKEAKPQVITQVVEKVVEKQVTSFTLSDKVLFEFGSSELVSNSALDTVLAFAREHEDSSISIIGHTDSVGSDVYNQELSYMRAKSIADFLEAKGIDNSRLTIVGMGAKEPMMSNDTEAGRAYNRRVEIVIGN